MSNTKEKQPFKWRGFISFGLFISFIIMTISGVVLYFAPPGRVAKWVIWEFSGLTKSQWQAQHTLFSLLFLILSIFHIFSLNWKTFLHYIKKKSREGIHMKKELLWSIIVSLAVFVGTLLNIPPFKTVMTIGETLTESWEDTNQQAPVSHTEAMTINEISKELIHIPSENLIKKLQSAGINCSDSEETLKIIAERNNTSPFSLYQLLAKGETDTGPTIGTLKSAGGLGRKTLQQVADTINLDVTIIIQALEKKNIHASNNQRIKDIAEKSDKTPLEIIEIIESIEK